MMNILKEESDDDSYSNEEPSISYYSSSVNCGVSTLLTSRERNPIKNKNKDIFLSSFSSNNSFCLYNTIMLPLITNDKALTNSNNSNKSIDANKENDKSHVSLIEDKDKTNNDAVPSNKEIKENENISQQKVNKDVANKCFIVNDNTNPNKSDNHLKKIKTINEELYNKYELNEDEKSNEIKSRAIEEEPTAFLLRGKSMIVDYNKKSSLMNKSEINSKKNNITKSKNALLELKIRKNNKLKLKSLRNKNQIKLVKSKSFIERANFKKK